MLFWGALVALPGLALLAAQGWARWFAFLVVAFISRTRPGEPGETSYPGNAD
jgi:hypothetical protein